MALPSALPTCRRWCRRATTPLPTHGIATGRATVRRSRLSVALTCFTLFSMAGCEPPPPAPTPPDLAAAQDVGRFETAFPGPGEDFGALRERLAEASIPGLAVAVIDGGETLWARSWGVTEVGTETPVGVDSPFSIEPLRPLFEEILALRHGADAPADLGPALVDELFEPLALQSTSFLRDDASGPGTARGHHATGQAVASRGVERLHTSANDLALLLADLQKAKAGKPSRRLNRDQAALFFRREGTGTGHATHFDRVATADGVTVRATAFVHSGHGAVVLANRADAEAFTDEVIQVLAALYDWPALRDPAVDARVQRQALANPVPVDDPVVEPLVIEDPVQVDGPAQTEGVETEPGL